MKRLFFTSLIPFLMSLPAMGRGGDVVNNGGGLTEQSLLTAAFHQPYLIQSCLQYRECGAEGPIQGYLKKLQACPIPHLSDLKFKTPKELQGLEGKPYLSTADQGFVINRTELYRTFPEPLPFSGAFAHLTRLYLDHCGLLTLPESQEFERTLNHFATVRFEQVTIGKDLLNLPQKDWLRIRAINSNLIFESPLEMHRLGCLKAEGGECRLLQPGETSTALRFKNLSLIDESQSENLISFLIAGTFVSPQGVVRHFQLQGQYHIENGIQSWKWEIEP